MDALPPVLARCVSSPLYDDQDEPPPWLIERYRDITHDIHRAAFEAQQEEPNHEQQDPHQD